MTRSTYFGFVSFLIVAMIVAGAGCSHLDRSTECRLHPTEAVTESLGTVDVGGNVHVPRSITISPEGLTLQRALALAGGSRDSLHVSSVASTLVPGEIVDRFSVSADRYESSKYLLEVMATRCPQDLNGRSLDEVRRQTDQFRGDYEKAEKELLDLASKESVATLRSAVIANVKLRARAESGCGDPELTAVELRERQKAAEVAVIEAKDAIQPKQTAQAVQASSLQLVQVQRITDGGIRNMYFTYDLATTGLSGQLTLFNGDLIQVVNVESTGLAQDADVLTNRPIQLAGFVKEPGLRNLSGTNLLGKLNEQASNVNIREPVWMVQQKGADGLTDEIYILPTRAMELSTSLGQLPVRPGASYTHTSLLGIPTIADSAVRRIVTASSTNPTERLGDCRDRMEQRLDERQAEADGIGGTLLKSVRGLSKTVGSRLGLR